MSYPTINYLPIKKLPSLTWLLFLSSSYHIFIALYSSRSITKSNEFNTFNNSKSSSISSRASLSSLKDSLPDNPHIYDLSEIRAAAKNFLQKPIILVKLYGASISGNCIYLVYEYIHGANLSDCLRNPRNLNFTVLCNWVFRVQIVAGIADGLEYKHNCAGFRGGFIHNHVKSSSIVICEEPALVAKICHFGTAQLCGDVPEAINEEDEEEDESGYQVLKG